MGIVFAGAGSHAPGIRAWADAAEKEAKENFYSAYDQLNKSFDNSGAEVLITLTSEHWTNFFLDHSSAFCIGRAEQYSGPVELWLGIEPRKIPKLCNTKFRRTDRSYIFQHANGSQTIRKKMFQIRPSNWRVTQREITKNWCYCYRWSFS